MSAPITPQVPRRIAVIGTGITGMSAAWLASQAPDTEVTVFEREGRIGGHTNTVVTPEGTPVDTGFIVYNEATYPNLIALFAHLGVATHSTDMAFAVSVDDGALEYGSDNLASLFAQRRNWVSPRFHHMWIDILRFFGAATRLLDEPLDPSLSLGAFLRREGYGRPFLEDHLLPMGAAIWSCTSQEMEAFPAHSFVRFFRNHGLLQLRDRPQWFTVTGGAREYAAKLTACYRDRIRVGDGAAAVWRQPDGVHLRGADGATHRFDDVIFACHADEALALLDDPSPGERAVLGAFRFSDNTAILHRDATTMPKARKAWASWNYMTRHTRGRRPDSQPAEVSVTYWMNRLQGIDPANPLFVSLNPLGDPADEIARFSYTHPIFDAATLRAQLRLGDIQGVQGCWYGGAWAGYGFHEDGVSAGLAMAEQATGLRRPWARQGDWQDSSPAGAHVTATRPVTPMDRAA